MINVLVVDDHEVVWKGLELIFKQTKDIRLTGATDNEAEALQFLHQNHQTDVLILDLDMPKSNGLTLLRRIKADFPGLKTLIYSMHPEDIYAISCVKSGAGGYTNKSAPVEELLAAIRKVAEKTDVYMSPELSEKMREIKLAKDPAIDILHRRIYKRLSIREVEVLKLLTTGKRNKQVAEELGINEKTVSTYKARLLRKLNVSNMVELINYTQNAEIREKRI